MTIWMNKQLVIETAKIKHNIKVVKERTGGVKIYGVIKGDAYGMGIKNVIGIFKDAGINAFAVSEIDELIMLREASNCDDEVLVMRSTCVPEELEQLVHYNAVATVGSTLAYEMLNEYAKKAATVVNAHIEIDTGMGRYGFLPQEKDKVLEIFKNPDAVNIQGIYTHFAKAFCDRKSVKNQTAEFLSVVDYIKSKNIDVGIVHAANSSALFLHPETIFDAVRIGSAFTGRLSAKGKFGLQSVGFAQCGIIDIHTLPKGVTIGYGSEFKTKKETKVAIIPIGYADGFCVEKAKDQFGIKTSIIQSLVVIKSFLTKKKITVGINKKNARVLGHIGMLHTVVDVSNIDCEIGDMAIMNVNIIIAGQMLNRKKV